MVRTDQLELLLTPGITDLAKEELGANYRRG